MTLGGWRGLGWRVIRPTIGVGGPFLPDDEVIRVSSVTVLPGWLVCLSVRPVRWPCTLCLCVCVCLGWVPGRVVTLFITSLLRYLRDLRDLKDMTTANKMAVI